MILRNRAAQPNTALTPVQHPTKQQLEEAIVGSYDGVFANSLRYAQFSLDELAAKLGQQFIEDMLRLSACRAPFNLKRYAVLRDGWEILPAIDDPSHADVGSAKEIADAYRLAMNNIVDPETDTVQDPMMLIFDMMYGSWGGNRVGEMVYGYQEGGDLAGKHSYRGIYMKPGKQIGYDVDPRTMAVRNVTSYTPQGGYDFDIPVVKCLHFVANQSANNPQGAGDWHPCYPHWMRINADMKFWAVALERWGAVSLLMEYPAGDLGALEAALKAGDRIRGGSTAAIPNNVKATALTAPTNVFDAMKQAADWDTRMIATVVLGNTLSTGEGEHGATSAGSDVHQDAGDIVYDALSSAVCSTWKRQAIRRWVRYNYGEKALSLCPSLRLRIPSEGDTYQTAQALQILNSIGNLPSKSKLIREKMSLPPIDADEEALLDAEKQAQQEASAQIADARNSNRIAKMSSVEAERIVGALTEMLYARNIARFDDDKGGEQWITVNGHSFPLNPDKAGGSGKGGGAGGETPSVSAKAMLAKQSAKYVGKEIQQYAEEHNEPQFARAVGGNSLKDNEPVDVMISSGGKVQHGIELKTMVDNANGKITMKASAIARKADWMKTNDAEFHTVVFDDQKVFNGKGAGKHDDSKRQIFYKRGFGSFRISSMYRVNSMEELQKLIETPHKDLPSSAQPPKSYGH